MRVLFGIECLTPNRSLDHSSSMASLVHFLSLGSCLIERVVLCLTCLSLSTGVLVLWHALDNDSVFNTFLYCLFAYDDTMLVWELFTIEVEVYGSCTPLTRMSPYG